MPHAVAAAAVGVEDGSDLDLCLIALELARGVACDERVGEGLDCFSPQMPDRRRHPVRRHLQQRMSVCPVLIRLWILPAEIISVHVRRDGLLELAGLAGLMRTPGYAQALGIHALLNASLDGRLRERAPHVLGVDGVARLRV